VVALRPSQPQKKQPPAGKGHRPCIPSSALGPTLKRDPPTHIVRPDLIRTKAFFAQAPRRKKSQTPRQARSDGQGINPSPQKPRDTCHRAYASPAFRHSRSIRDPPSAFPPSRECQICMSFVIRVNVIHLRAHGLLDMPQTREISRGPLSCRSIH
jgi:hypothetical protein